MSEHVLTINHYVRVQSTVPAIAGQFTAIYVRERIKAEAVARGLPFINRVVLFVHGSGAPSEVAFDIPYRDYSWMAYLAQANFDAFAVDLTGYGRSTRPLQMNDPCNLSGEQQLGLIPALLPKVCAPSYPYQLTTIGSDWDDIDAAVDYVRALRHVDRVSLIGWSLGGPRAGGYAAQHPEKVDKLVLLAPSYERASPGHPPEKLPVKGAAMTKLSRDDLAADWNKGVVCRGQYDPAVRDAAWSQYLESDPVGATWGKGVRRAPETTVWGWNAEVAAKMQTPTLLVSGAHDKDVPTLQVRNLYEDLGSRQKIFIDLACASHDAQWEKNHVLLFRASLQWLTDGAVNGVKEGALRLGY
ncbi:MAG: lysophospholipase [Candidatus Eremiobacteraeota bacterium]|nr:lysophospholipase [Candidatus Eremiobacteraeota bacterium]